MIGIILLLFCITACHSASIRTDRCDLYLKTLHPGGNTSEGNLNIVIFGSHVNFNCFNDTTLSGSEKVRCFENGSWSAAIPKCLVNCPPITVDSPFIITGGNINDVKTDDKERYEGKTIILSCVTSGYVVDGQSHITCQSNRKWMPNVPRCKPKPIPPDRRWMTILAIAGPSGLILFVLIIVAGKFLLRWRENRRERSQAIELSDKFNSTQFYRIWTIGRCHKKLISAVDLRDLKAKTSKLINNEDGQGVKIVLEEDGTEVTTSAAMVMSHDKILMVLQKNEGWTPLSIAESNKLKLTYDVCSFDRSKRKLFLAGSLDELLVTVKKEFGYEANYVCLEEDGTIVGDDRSLTVVAGQPIMSLRNVDDWSHFTSRDNNRNNIVPGRIPQIDLTSITPKDRRNCYKVWTEDQHYKRIVFATDVVDLHIKAAKLLDLPPPIEISVLDEDVIITDNLLLGDHKNHILVATEAREIYTSAAPSIYSSIDGRMSNFHSQLPDVLHQTTTRRNNTYF